MKLDGARPGMRVRVRLVHGGAWSGPLSYSARRIGDVVGAGVVERVETDLVVVKLDGVKPPIWPYCWCSPDMLEVDETATGAAVPVWSSVRIIEALYEEVANVLLTCYDRDRKALEDLWSDEPGDVAYLRDLIERVRTERQGKWGKVGAGG